MIIAIDFDGTIHKGAYPNIGIPKYYAKEAINKLKREGHCIIIWTCREGEMKNKMVSWLIKKGISFDYVNENHPDNIEKFNNDSRKVFADVYIDDKQVGDLPSWDKIYKMLSSKKRIKSVGQDILRILYASK
jgi:hypothetical protein